MSRLMEHAEREMRRAGLYEERNDMCGHRFIDCAKEALARVEGMSK
jgi:hypothetical protein